LIGPFFNGIIKLINKTTDEGRVLVLDLLFATIVGLSFIVLKAIK